MVYRFLSVANPAGIESGATSMSKLGRREREVGENSECQQTGLYIAIACCSPAWARPIVPSAGGRFGCLFCLALQSLEQWSVGRLLAGLVGVGHA